MDKSTTTYVGLDVHKDEIVVAMLEPGKERAQLWKLRNEQREIARLIRRLGKHAADRLLCVYEAGPCGYQLQRHLVSKGISTEIVAPSLIPIKPGDRIKTDRRDAVKLALAARAEMLTFVKPPDEMQEAIRDLCRCRQAAVKDLTRARHRLSKFLLRRGFVYRSGRNWTQRHRQWLHKIRFEDLVTRGVFEDYLTAIEQLEERLLGLQARMAEVAQHEPYRESVAMLRCFRGFDTVSALTIMSELQDLQRFPTPRHLMSYLGLVPSEHSSGGKTQRGAITKTGNSHVRRCLVEAAWHYRHRPAVGKALRQRRQDQPQPVIAIADRAQSRLHRRFHRLVYATRKPPQKAVVAVARELAGFLWAALQISNKQLQVA